MPSKVLVPRHLNHQLEAKDLSISDSSVSSRRSEIPIVHRPAPQIPYATILDEFCGRRSSLRHLFAESRCVTLSNTFSAAGFLACRKRYRPRSPARKRSAQCEGRGTSSFGHANRSARACGSLQYGTQEPHAAQLHQCHPVHAAHAGANASKLSEQNMLLLSVHAI